MMEGPRFERLIPWQKARWRRDKPGQTRDFGFYVEQLRASFTSCPFQEWTEAVDKFARDPWRGPSALPMPPAAPVELPRRGPRGGKSLPGPAQERARVALLAIGEAQWHLKPFKRVAAAVNAWDAEHGKLSGKVAGKAPPPSGGLKTDSVKRALKALLTR